MTVMIQSGLDLGPIVTHRFPYEEYERGFQAMLQGNSGKVVLNWE
jgi:threonine 3-dehydrogenase